MTLFDQIWFGGVEWHAVEWSVEAKFVHDKGAVHLRGFMRQCQCQ